MEEKIYLIYNDCADDCASIKGYIKGTKEDADRYCDEYNSHCEYEWQEIWWAELKNLTGTKPKGQE